jgi:Tol biopolymer transport system component
MSSLVAGSRLGPYEILSAIGVGGMGEVYKATDTNLKRAVAVKVLPQALAGDADRLARFQREAEVLARLNHPNIAHVYGLERSDAVTALVMELVEGEDLGQRLARGPIPLDEALPIAKQIAEALEAAHEQGIVHRDLKPANIKVKADGTVKVLDFGLAKALDPTPTGVTNLANSPTLTLQATQAGIVLGTAAYMSPEQARGTAVDKRTDLWALGVVLYEMLTGERLFDGATVSDTLASVLRAEPNWSRLPAATPTTLRKFLRRCLEKDRRQRFADAADARWELNEAVAELGEPPVANGGAIEQRAPLMRTRPAWIAAAVLAVVGVGVTTVAIAVARQAVPAPPEIRVDIATPPTTAPLSFALSPDGRSIAFVATSDGRPKLWLRSLRDSRVGSLSGTEGARLPFWSPDSRSLGFFADQRLKRIDVGGGTPKVLASAPSATGGTWGSEGTIVFAPAGIGGLSRVSAEGGQTTAVTRLEASQVAHRRPAFLRDGRHFVFFAVGNVGNALYLASLDGAPTRRLFEADAGTAVTAHEVLFVRQGKLFAQAIRPGRLEMIGDPLLIADRVSTALGSVAALSASASGTVAFRSGPESEQRQLIWFDRSGNEVGRVGPSDASNSGPELSPDRRRIAQWRVMNGNTDIWVFDAERGVASRVTSDEALDLNPTWSPDGRQLAFFSTRDGALALYLKATSGAGSEERLFSSPSLKSPTDWSTDGRFLLYDETNATETGNFDIWALPMDTHKPFPVVQTKFIERDAKFSPDGKWIAYQADTSGQFEVYVQPFPGPGDRVQVSTTGGTQVRWRRDGRELFYMAFDGRLMAVAVRPMANRGMLELGTPVPLFLTHVPDGAVQGGGGRQQYDVSADGQRFLVNTVPEASTPITLVLNPTMPSGK